MPGRRQSRWLFNRVVVYATEMELTLWHLTWAFMKSPFAPAHYYPEAFRLRMADLERGYIWLLQYELLGWARRVVRQKEV